MQFPRIELKNVVRENQESFWRKERVSLWPKKSRKLSWIKGGSFWLREGAVYNCEGWFGLANNSTWSYLPNFPKGALLWLGLSHPWGWIALTGHHWPQITKKVIHKPIKDKFEPIASVWLMIWLFNAYVSINSECFALDCRNNRSILCAMMLKRSTGNRSCY